jgi:protein-disulfide isomerase
VALARFRRDLDAPETRAAIDADVALAERQGARGTPTFFLNGTPLTGDQPIGRVVSLLDRVLARAREIAPPEEAYARMVEDPVRLVEVPPPPRDPVVDEGRVMALRPSARAPSRGPADAPVVIEHFGDFQCPFCARAAPTLEALEALYEGRVRIVWRDYPLASHPNALTAAEAAREVFAQQGDEDFWCYREVLLSHQWALSRRDLERYAREQGVDLRRFRAALEQHTHYPAIRADLAALDDTHLRVGTPATFVNGRFVEGAQPLEVFQRAVDASLASWPEGSGEKRVAGD